MKDLQGISYYLQMEGENIMTWNNKNSREHGMSDSQYMRQLNVWQNKDSVSDINREIKKMNKSDKNGSIIIKDRSLLSKILMFWK